MNQTPRTRRAAGLIALAALAVLTVFSLWAVQPPSPLGKDAPAAQFSAGRAFDHVQQVGSQVHVAGSPAAGDVRAYIETTLRGLGLQPQIQEGVGADDALGGFAMAHVRNVVAVLPGTAPTGRVFAFAHYDSVQVSYGGNDDGAGVATLLEAARALGVGAKPRNDIVFIFTDAEEACLCGAEAFVDQNPLAASGGVALNFEARGSSGPAVMFETSEDNADVVGVYGDSVPDPVATSFAVEVYRILPNDTDFTPFLRAGRFTGLNSAYIDGSPVYHTPQDQASYMDKRSLQAHGDNALALARALASADLAALSKPSSGDATYFPALGTLVRYPGWLVWPLAVLSLLAVLALAFLVRRRSAATAPRLAAGFGLALVPLLAAPILTQLLWSLLVALRPGYARMIDPWRPGWFRLAVAFLVIAVLLAWYALLRRRIGTWPLLVGALGWLAVLGVVLAALTPGGSYLAALPALFGAAALTGTLFVPHWWQRLLLVGVGGAVAVVILAPTVLLFFPALGLATGGVAALFATMLGFALLPVLPSTELLSSDRFPNPSIKEEPPETESPAEEPPAEESPAEERSGRAVPAWAPGAVAAVFTIASVIAGLSVDRFDAEHPYPTELMYALDADTNKAIWVGADSSGYSWANQHMNRRQDISKSFPLLRGQRQFGEATAAELPAPTLEVVSQSVDGDRRTVTVLLKPQREARLVFLGVPENVGVLKAAAGGRAVPPNALEKPFGLLFHAPGAEGVTITLTFDTAQPVPLRAMAGSDGLDGLPGFEPPPPGVVIAGSHTSQLVLVAKTYTL